MEKFLKAFLLSKGWKLVRTHNLVTLLDEVVSYDSIFNNFRFALQEISLYYLDSRYPISLSISWSEQDVRNSYHDVQGLIKQIRAALQPITS